MSRIIVMFKNGDRELNMSLYDFIDVQYQLANPILVCHVTKEEYNNMKRQIKSGYLHERLPSSLRNDGSMGYNKFRYLISYDKISNNLLVSDYNNPDKRGSYIIDSKGIHYDKKGYQITNHPNPFAFYSDLKVYTTETYRDVIVHYESQQQIVN